MQREGTRRDETASAFAGSQTDRAGTLNPGLPISTEGLDSKRGGGRSRLLKIFPSQTTRHRPGPSRQKLVPAVQAEVTEFLVAERFHVTDSTLERQVRNPWHIPLAPSAGPSQYPADNPLPSLAAGIRPPQVLLAHREVEHSLLHQRGA